MESKAVRILFKNIMKGQQPAPTCELEIISLIYPPTMEEITVPVRNRGCNEARVCVWPLESLMKEVQEEARRANFREPAG